MPAKREMNGWLKKRPNKGNIGGAHRRWFVLESPILSWYTSELEHDQKGFATLTKYSSVTQLPRGNQLGPNIEVTANSEQIFIAEATNAEEATEWVLTLNDCIKRLRSGKSGADAAASEMERKLMEQAMAETRRMEQMQAQHRQRQNSSAAEQERLAALQSEARKAQMNAESVAGDLEDLKSQHAAQMDQQSASYQQQLQDLQAELDAQQNESLQTMETTLIEMEEMQAKLDSAHAEIEQLKANGGTGTGAVSAEELEMAAAAIQEDNKAEMEKVKATHAAQIEKMTKERTILIREVKKLQKAVQQASAAGSGGADSAEIQRLTQELADKDALLAQQAEEVEALIAMQAEQEALTDSKVAEALETAKKEHAADIAARGEEMQKALQRQADGFNVERAGHQTQLESMQSQLKALQETGSSQGVRAQQAIAAEKAMQEAMLEYDQRLKEMQVKADEDAASHQAAMATAKAEASTLRSQLETTEAKAAEVDAARAEADVLASTIEEMEVAAANTKQEHDAELQGLAEALKESKAAAETEAASLKAQVDRLQEAATAANQGQGAAAAQAQAQVAALEREIANLNEQLNRVEADLDAEQQKAAAAAAKQAESETAAIAAEMELKSKLAEAEQQLEARAGDEASRIESEVELKAKLADAEAKQAAAERSVEELNTKISTIEGQHAQQISKMESEARAASAAAAAAGQSEEQQEEAIYQAIQSLQEEHDEKTKVREAEFAEQLKASKVAMDEVTTKLEAMTTERDAVVADLAEKEAAHASALAALQQQANESSAAVAQAKADLAAANEALEQAQSAAANTTTTDAIAKAEAAAAEAAETTKALEEHFSLERTKLEAAVAAAQKEAAEAIATAEATEAALAEVSQAGAPASAGGFTQADIDAAVEKEVAAQAEAHKKELMAVRINAAKRLAASPRNSPVAAQAPAPAPAVAASEEELTSLRAEVKSLKEEAGKVAGIRQKEKLVLVTEIRKNRTLLQEKSDEITKLQADMETAKSAAATQASAADIGTSSAELEEQLKAANVKAEQAQTTIGLQHDEIKRLKARIAELEAKLAELEGHSAAAVPPIQTGKHEHEDSSRNKPESPAVRRVKQAVTPGSVGSRTSFGSSQFDSDTQDEDDTDYDPPAADSPRTRHAPKIGHEPSYVADGEDEEDIDDEDDDQDLPDEEEERLAEMEDEMVNWLHDNGFGEFEAGVLDLGVEMMDDLKLLSHEDLSEIGMSEATAENFMYTVGSRFKVGQRISIVNLTKAQMFNGLTGFVTDPIKEGRYTIKLDHSPPGSAQTLVSCYPTNLVKATDLAPGSDDNGGSPGSTPADTLVSRTRTESADSQKRNANSDQKSKLISESVSPKDTLSMVRNPGTFARTTSGTNQRVSLSATEWTEVDCADHPPPRCSLESPLIQQILQSWTRSRERLDKMNAWLSAIMRGSFNDPDFSWGIEVAELTPEVANGFLTVLLPLVVIRAPMLVNVYVRLSHPVADRRHQATIDLRLSLNGWQQVDCSMNPPPKCDILSPLIQNLLECWTSNRERLRRMNDWLQTVMVGRFDDENFMDGIEMLELAPEIVQGFLTMLVPLIQARAPVKVKVYLRQALKSAYITLQQKNQNLLDLLEPQHSEGVIMDLRLSVTPRDYTYTP